MESPMVNTIIPTTNAAMFIELCKVLPNYIYQSGMYGDSVQINITVVNEFVTVTTVSIVNANIMSNLVVRLRWNPAVNTYVPFLPEQCSNDELINMTILLHKQLVDINHIALLMGVNPYVVENWLRRSIFPNVQDITSAGINC